MSFFRLTLRDTHVHIRGMPTEDIFSEIDASLTPAERESERRAAAHLARPLPTVRWPDGVPRGAAVLHELNATLRRESFESAPTPPDSDELEIALALNEWRGTLARRHGSVAVLRQRTLERHLAVIDERGLRRSA